MLNFRWMWMQPLFVPWYENRLKTRIPMSYNIEWCNPMRDIDSLAWMTMRPLAADEFVIRGLWIDFVFAARSIDLCQHYCSPVDRSSSNWWPYAWDGTQSQPLAEIVDTFDSQRPNRCNPNIRICDPNSCHPNAECGYHCWFDSCLTHHR